VNVLKRIVVFSSLNLSAMLAQVQQPVRSHDPSGSDHENNDHDDEDNNGDHGDHGDAHHGDDSNSNVDSSPAAAAPDLKRRRID
jgi:hypothetical protein